MNITSLTSTVNSLGCTEVNDRVTDRIFELLSSQNTFHMSNVACLDEGTEYEVTISHFQQNTVFELDSVGNNSIL